MTVSNTGNQLKKIAEGRLRDADFRQRFRRELKVLPIPWGRRAILALLSDRRFYTFRQINSMFSRGKTELTRRLYQGNYARHRVRLLSDKFREIGSQYRFKVTRAGAQLVDSTTTRPLGERTPRRRVSPDKALTAMRRLDSLEKRGKAFARTEQRYWRPLLFGHQETWECAICAERFPVELLVAGHIKRRASCPDPEKLDKANVMPICKFGCDALFEDGYITVHEGRIRWNSRKKTTKAVRKYVTRIEKRICLYWNHDSARYFEAHRQMHPR